MLKMSVKEVTTNLNFDDSRPHLDGEEDKGRHSGESVRQACSEDLAMGSLNPHAQPVEHSISYRKMYGVAVFETLSGATLSIKVSPKYF